MNINFKDTCEDLYSFKAMKKLKQDICQTEDDDVVNFHNFIITNVEDIYNVVFELTPEKRLFVATTFTSDGVISSIRAFVEGVIFCKQYGDIINE